MINYFYDTIYQLRTKEALILYDKVLEFKPSDEEVMKAFLGMEYEEELLNYPFSAPFFNAEAAFWGAKTVYMACQVLLYREHDVRELGSLLPPFSGEITAEAMLSADLCLRFLPQILTEAKFIDPEDALIPILEVLLAQWHYSGVGVAIELEQMDFEPVFSNSCLEQLYIDRVIEKKDVKRAEQPRLKEKIGATMGNYLEDYWKEFK
jgi:hypothetical protein